MSVVCDTGSGSIKLGWSYSTYPDHTIPTLLGQPNRRYKYSDYPQEHINVKKYSEGLF